MCYNLYNNGDTMKKIKYNIDYDLFYKPILGLVLVLSSIKLVNYTTLLKKDGIFNYLLILHILLIILCDLVISFPYLFQFTNKKTDKLFNKLANKCNGKIVKVHHKNGYTNLEIKYYSKILKKYITFFSKQIKYNLPDVDDTEVKCEVYELEENKLPIKLGSSVLTKYSFITNKNKKIIVVADKMDNFLSFFDRYFDYILFISILIIEIFLVITI